jgi:LacI family transcriptional regulator
MGLSLLKDKGILEAVPGKGYRKRKKNVPKPKTNLIGLVLAGSRDSGPSSEMANSVYMAIQDSEYHLLYSNCMDSLVKQKTIIKSLVKKGVDGLIIVPVYKKNEEWQDPDNMGMLNFLKKIKDDGTPIVLMDRSYNSAVLPCVSNDDVKGGYLAAHYLIDKGHKKILYIGGIKKDWISAKRYQGYMMAIEEARLKPYSFSLDKYLNNKEFWNASKRKEIIFSAINKFSEVSAVQTTGDAADLIQDIVAESDNISPKECIGYDTPPISGFPYMKRPLDLIGQMASEKMIRLINGEKVKQLNWIAPEIIQEI